MSVTSKCWLTSPEGVAPSGKRHHALVLMIHAECVPAIHLNLDVWGGVYMRARSEQITLTIEGEIAIKEQTEVVCSRRVASHIIQVIRRISHIYDIHTHRNQAKGAASLLQGLSRCISSPVAVSLVCLVYLYIFLPPACW